MKSSATKLVEPVRVLSDLHLAHPASQIREVESLRPLIAGSGTVVFNGDTCEQCYHGWVEEGRSKLAELKELCREEGAEPIFLAGNHDPEISEQGWLECEGGRVLITHGHALYPGVAPWSPEFISRRGEVLEIMRERGIAGELGEHWHTTKALTEALKPGASRRKKSRYYLLSAFWPPRRSFHILRVWMTMVHEAEGFLRRFRPEVQMLMFGHFHRRGVWRRGVRTLCNSGAFMSGARPLAGSLHEGWVRMAEVENRKGEYRLAAARTTIRLRDQ